MHQRRWVTQVATMILGLITLASTAGRAQDLAQADRGPRFLLRSVGKAAPVPVDMNATRVLRQRVALTHDDAKLAELLGSIHKQTGLKFVYSADVIPIDRIVHLRADSITVAAALTELLVDLGVDVVFYSAREAGLVRRWDWGRQAGAIVGRVMDAKTGGAIADAEVLLKDSRWRAATDTAGRYRLMDVDAGQYTLTVRRLGYAKLSRPVTVREGEVDTVDVALKPVAAKLDELVTTATGMQRRRHVASDVTVLDVDSIVRTQPVKNVTDILEGRVPGLIVQRTSGAPGDPARLRLRGASSPLLSNDPIVVVDGVRVYAEQSAARSANLVAGAGSQQFAKPSPLDYIDPASIETIEVVKGASAATLYGQDAANGVIVITTKKGRAGPTRWTVGAEHGITEMIGRYPERVVRWGHAPYVASPVICPLGDVYRAYVPNVCAGDSVVQFQLLNEPDLTLFGRGQATATTLGVSGGTAALTYNVTSTYRHEIGLLRLPDYEIARYQVRLGTTPPDWMRRPQNLTQWGVASNIEARLGATAGLSLHTSLSQTDQQRSMLESQIGDLDATYLDRASGAYYRLNTTPSGSASVSASASPTLGGYYTKVTSAATQLTSGVTLDWRPWSWLRANANAGIDVIQSLDGLWLPQSASLDADSVGALNDGRGKSIVRTMDLRAIANRTLGRGFTLRFVAGANYSSTSTSDLSLSTINLPPGQATLGSTVTQRGRETVDRATFGWYLAPAIIHQRFSVDLGLRLDGGSAYGSGVSGLQLPKFPKLGFSYLISDEAWFPLKSLVQSLRVRLAYGRASRQPGPVERLRLYGGTTLVLADSQLVPGVVLQTLGNTTLRPERSSEIEGGFDADLLDSRITLGVTGYRKTTDDLLLDTPLPPSLFIGTVTSNIRNIGMTRNTGLDVQVEVQLLQSASVTWGTGLAVSHRRDEVVKLGPGVTPFYLSGSDGRQRVIPGYPLFGVWARPVMGYADANGNGVIEPNEIVVGDTAIYRGATLPDYTATLHTSASFWHGAVSVSADLLYDKGMTQGLGDAEISRFAALSSGLHDRTTSASEQVFARSAFLTPYYWLQPVSTTRLNSVSVTYTAPSALARRIGAERLQLSLQGSNLGVWTNYRGLDPNVNAASSGNVLVDAGTLPRPRTWQVRMNLTY